MVPARGPSGARMIMPCTNCTSALCSLPRRRRCRLRRQSGGTVYQCYGEHSRRGTGRQLLSLHTTPHVLAVAVS